MTNLPVGMLVSVGVLIAIGLIKHELLGEMWREEADANTA